MAFTVNCRRCGADWGCLAVTADWEKAGMSGAIEHPWTQAEKTAFLGGGGCPQCSGKPEDDPLWRGIVDLLGTENVAYFEAATAAYWGEDDEADDQDRVDRAFGFALSRLITQMESGDVDALIEQHVEQREREGWATEWPAQVRGAPSVDGLASTEPDTGQGAGCYLSGTVVAH